MVVVVYTRTFQRGLDTGTLKSEENTPECKSSEVKL